MMESKFSEINEDPKTADERGKFIHHAEAIGDLREPYGPTGMSVIRVLNRCNRSGPVDD